MPSMTRFAWLDVVLGFLCGISLTLLLTVLFAAWYVFHMGPEAPVLWASYAFWFGALVVSLCLWARLHRCPVFATGFLLGGSVASMLLIAAIWLLDNEIGFSA